MNATRVTTSSKFEAAGRPDNMMRRTVGAMTWSSGAGILLIDYDPEGTVLTPTELREALYQCCPPLRKVAHVWSTSTSSCLFSAKTEAEVRGIRASGFTCSSPMPLPSPVRPRYSANRHG